MRNYNTNDDLDEVPQRSYQTRYGRETQYRSRSYNYRPYPYYDRRYYYNNHGFFRGPFGW